MNARSTMFLSTATAIAAVPFFSYASVTISRESILWPVENKQLIAEATTRKSFIAHEQVTDSLSKSFFHPAVERLLSFKSLDADFNGENAPRPDTTAIELAASFVELLPFFAPQPSVGVNSEGQAVVEFHDENELGQVVFLGDNQVEAYYSRDDAPSVYLEGNIQDPDIQLAFRRAFGFPLVA
ncbi:hypothetical protein P8H26_14855 [Pseudochrobactrum sp. sp1633]|uniref:hypothetical protein n=1 Tax=Pseudochrobactrum sp. sp1633 TaxID=3036706 RepID=UPI0025A4E55F|nr:hypothetical protein [Pseudochrobactrum sp. sp1633]MDM8346670.1 hypothetical protein [Pseudochrobactrum sp. sp1633]